MWIVYSLLASSIWALENVLDSIVVHKYNKDPISLLWIASLFRVGFVLLIPVFFTVHLSYATPLLLAGCCMFVGAGIYYILMERLDASVTQSAWAFESIVLSILGIVFLGESWSYAQFVGALCILGGVFFVTYWHKHISVLQTVGWLLLLAVATAPAEFTQKVILEQGVDVVTVLFWYLLGRDLIAIVFPVFYRPARSSIKSLVTDVPPLFYGIILVTVLLSFVAFTCGTLAYATGPISLVAIVGNIQPFMVMVFAWIIYVCKFSHAPKELITKQSVGIKIISFLAVFIGLALLTIS